MSERALASRVVQILKSLDAVRVENPCHPGTPDVNYAEGWLELKQVDKWPVRDETPVRVEHFTPQQKIWLSRRIRKGGRAHVLIQVERDYILLRGDVASELLGEATKKDLLAASIFHCSSRELPEKLINALIQ